MLAALFSSLLIGLVESAAASPLNPEQTIIRPPAELQWKPNPAYSELSVDNCILAGDINRRALLHPDTLVARFHERAAPLYAAIGYASSSRHVVVRHSGADFDPGPVFRCGGVSFAGLRDAAL